LINLLDLCGGIELYGVCESNDVCILEVYITVGLREFNWNTNSNVLYVCELDILTL